MEKDKRYLTVKKLILSGDIQFFDDIFEYISRDRVRQDLGFNFDRLKKLITQVDGWVLRDLYRLCEFIEIDFEVISKLIDKQYQRDKKLKSLK